MKKIILLVVTILMAGMLAGCASTSGVSNTSKTSNKSNKAPFNGVYDESFGDVYDDVYWRFHDSGFLSPIECDLDKVYQLKKASDFDQQYRIQNTFNMIIEKMINRTELSGRDYYKLFWCEKYMEKENSYPYFMLEDFLNEREIIGKESITGKIINNTDKTLHMALLTRRQDQRHFYFEIPSREEKEFKIPKVTELNESFFAVEDVYKTFITWIGVESPDYRENGRSEYHQLSIDLQEKFARYIFDNYSFEMIIDDNTSPYWKNNIDDWRLVPRYETEKTVLTDALDYSEIQKVLSKYR